MKTYRKNLPLLLLSARERVRARFQPTLRQFGLTEQQWRILRLLEERGDLGLTDIADACLIFRASMVGIVARMETLDLVARSRVVGDKRRVSISLTPAGRRVVENILPIFDTIYQDLEAELGARTLDDLYGLLEVLELRLAAAPAVAPDIEP